MHFFSLDALYAPRLPDLYFWWKSGVLYLRFYGIWLKLIFPEVNKNECINKRQMQQFDQYYGLTGKRSNMDES